MNEDERRRKIAEHAREIRRLMLVGNPPEKPEREAIRRLLEALEDEYNITYVL